MRTGSKAPPLRTHKQLFAHILWKAITASPPGASVCVLYLVLHQLMLLTRAQKSKPHWRCPRRFLVVR